MGWVISEAHHWNKDLRYKMPLYVKRAVTTVVIIERTCVGMSKIIIKLKTVYL